MAYSSTVDERYIGFTEYSAYLLDVGGTKYSISPGPGALKEGAWAYGATSPSSGYSFSDTGEVTLNESPDYEAKTQFVFTVTASDGLLTDTVDVTLNVIRGV